MLRYMEQHLLPIHYYQFERMLSCHKDHTLDNVQQILRFLKFKAWTEDTCMPGLS